eukprot:3715028-Pleurochrysis_carterae.AAC.1
MGEVGPSCEASKQTERSLPGVTLQPSFERPKPPGARRLKSASRSDSLAGMTTPPAAASLVHEPSKLTPPGEGLVEAGTGGRYSDDDYF